MPDNEKETAPQQRLTLPAFGEIESGRVLAVDDLFAVVHDNLQITSASDFGHTFQEGAVAALLG